MSSGHDCVETQSDLGPERVSDRSAEHPAKDPPGKAFAQYVERGFALVPLPPGQKSPRRTGWNRRENCITDPERARTLDAAGIAHAYCTPCTCAVDVDDLEVARRALREHGIDLDALLSADDAVRIERGDPNHTKLLYTLPEPLPTVKPITGLELRCATRSGATMHDCLPPSLHPSGRPYEWVYANDLIGDWKHLPPLPEPLRAFWEAELQPLPAEQPDAGSVAQAEVERLLAPIDPDCGYDEWIRIGMAVHHGTAGQGFEAWDEWSSRGGKYQGSDDLLPHWRSFDPSTASPVTINYLRQYQTAAPEDFDEAIGAPATGLRQVDLDGVMVAALEPPEFIIDPLLPRGYVTLLGGHGGSGKTMLALTWAAHVAAGREWAGFPIKQAPVAFVSLEDHDQLIQYRLRRIIEAYDLPEREIRENLRMFDCPGADATMVFERSAGSVLQETAMFDSFKSAVGNAGLVILDNASDAFGADENRRRHVREFMRKLANIAMQCDASVLLLAHIDKAAARDGSKGNSYSGSTAWHNTARSRLALLFENDQLKLRHEKHNLSPAAPTVRLEWRGAALMPITHDATAEGANADEQAAADAENVLELMKIAIAAGNIVTAARAGSSTTYHVLSVYPEFPAELSKKAGRRRFWAAISRLQREGTIRKTEYKKPNRQTGERWDLAQDAPVGVEKSAPVISPIPPSATGAHGARCASSRSAPVPGTGATDADSVAGGDND